MDETLHIAQAIQHVLRWGRDEGGKAWAWAADPVLGGAEFAWLLPGASARGKQNGVNFPDEAE